MGAESPKAAPLNATVGIIGAGSMGGAIARGLVATGSCSAADVCLCNRTPQKLEAFARDGFSTCADADSLVQRGTDVVILAVKPQVFPEVLSGASAVAPGSRATTADVQLVCALFGALGCAEVMREDQLDAEGAVIGCAPAFFALVVDALTRRGIEAGLPAQACRSMAEATMLGVARSLEQTGEHPRAYMEKVTSPGGTTAAALRAMEPGLVEAFYEGVDDALARTRELAGQ